MSSSSSFPNEAFVTLSTKDDYSCGALVLAQSLRQVGTTKKLVVMISTNLSEHFQNLLKEFYDEVIPVEELNTNDVEHLQLLGRPDLGVTLTKIHCWLLIQYSKCIFMDCDMFVLKNIDHLFEREEFSAAPDAGWPDCFNSGLFVYRPSKETFRQLMNFANQPNSSFDGGDQGILNSFFSNWSRSDLSHHLPFTYNVTSNTFYSYLPAIQKYHQNIHVVHFAGSVKPWHLTYNPTTNHLSGNLSSQNSIQRDFLLSWWKIFSKSILPKLSSSSSTSTENNFGQSNDYLTLNRSVGPSSFSSILNENEEILSGSVEHRRAWESGRIDYQGKDSFENILQKLNETIVQSDFHRPIESISSNEDRQSNSSLVSTTKQIDSTKSIEEEKIIDRLSSRCSSTTMNNERNVQEEIRSRKGNEWTVKSTMITYHRQGLTSSTESPTISKSVCQTVASIENLSSTSPRSTSTSFVTAKDQNPSNEYRPIDSTFVSRHWIVDKAFIALTYSISLIYLFISFLFRKASQRHSIDNVVQSSTSSSTLSNSTKKSVENLEKN